MNFKKLDAVHSILEGIVSIIVALILIAVSTKNNSESLVYFICVLIGSFETVCGLILFASGIKDYLENK